MADLRIGILTFHRCINYGSYWQAVCLAEGLKKSGFQVEIMDHYSRQVNVAEWKCAMRPVLPTPVPKADQALYKHKITRFFEAFESMPLSKCFEINTPSDMEEYDIVVVGSDEVWNLSHPWYGGCSLFYGEGLRANQIISYAASFGNYDPSLGLKSKWIDLLQNFDHISVRDDNSKYITQNALDIEPAVVLDPCLQFSVEPQVRNNRPEKPYMAVYGHNFSKSFIAGIRAWASKREIRMISIGYRNDWADEHWITADPHDFAHFMAGTVVVATNFFHGCVFALRNEKPFACETSIYRSNKIRCLMNQIGGAKHIIREDTTDAELKSILDEPINPEIIRNIDHLRQISSDYLDHALSTELQLV